MIQYGNIRRDLLDLLVKSGRPVDRANLVPVKVEANGKYGTYWTTKWKSPGEVAHDDKVVGNNHLLSKDHPQYKSSGSMFTENSHPPDYVKQHVDNFVEHTFGKEHQPLYDFLNKYNITWKRDASEGITYMRAKMALKKAVFFRGFDMLSPQAVTDVDNSKSTKPTTVPTPKVDRSPTPADAKAKAKAYFESIGKSDSVLQEHMSIWGINWPKSKKTDISDKAREGYNHMKMLEYLGAAIRDGFDPFAASTSSNNTSHTTPKPTDPSALVASANATDREKMLIEHINKMTDIDAIEACSRVGAVPEDNRAQEFIVNRLQRNLINTLSKADPKVKQRIDAEWGVGVLSRLKAQLFNNPNNKYDNTPEGFGRQMSDVLGIAGCKKNVIFEGFQTLAQSFNMAVLTDPRATLSTLMQNGAKSENGGTQIADVIQGLNEGYSNHTTDDYPGFYSNLGYSGYDPDKYSARFEMDDGDHDGFCLYLDKIAKNNDGVKGTVETMKDKYRELLHTCHGNPNLMNLVLHSDTWKDKPDSEYIPSSFGNTPLTSKEQAVAAVQQMDKSYKVVTDTLKQRGYSSADILAALQDTIHNDDLSNFHIAGDVINFREVKAPNNKPFLKKAECAWGTDALLCAQAMFVGEQSGDPELKKTSVPPAAAEAWGYYKAAKQVQNFTSEQYLQAHKLSHELFGLNTTYITNKDGKSVRVPVDYSKLNTNRSWRNQSVNFTTKDQSDTENTVLTNMLMGHMYHKVNTSIAQNVTKNTQGMFNNDGSDYSGNFDYYSGALMSSSDKRYTQLGNNSGNGATYTASQVSDKITQQTNAMPNYSAEYLDKVRQYYENVGHSAMGDSFAKFYNKGTESMMDNPIKDILFQVSHNIAGFVPNMATKPKYGTQTAKKLNYVAFDFNQTSGKQPRYNPSRVAAEPPPPDPAALKAARQKLLEKATCSLQTESKEVSKQYQQQMTGPGMDYKDPNKIDTLGGEKYESNPDGHTPTALLHTGNKIRPEDKRTVIFNSPVFKVNNSIYEEQFNKNHEKWSNSTVAQEKMGSATMELYQGLSYSALAGSLKQDQDVTDDTNAALGIGKYYTYKVGEAAKFVGDQHLNVSKNGNAALKEPARGIIGMATVMRGPNASKNLAKDLKSNVSSLSGDHYSNPPLRDFELCAKMAGLSHTHHVVDVTIVNLGINAIKTNDGIVKPSTRELIADNNGISVNMVYGEDVRANGY